MWRHHKLSLALLVVMTGCNPCVDNTLSNVPDHQSQTDEFCQRPASKVDILWVVDNSGSMASEQNKIADRFTEFFQQLGSSLVDYHIGVVTTSITPGQTEDANGILRKYDGPEVQGCNGCRGLTKDTPCAHLDKASRTDSDSNTAAYE